MTLAPFNPAEVMVIRKVTENITIFSVPFARFGRARIGGRGTVVRLQSGGVAVFSPVALTDQVKQTVSSLGEVKYIAAPDIEHHIFLGPWHAQYPSAKIIAPEGLPEKRAKQKNEEVRYDIVAKTSDKSISIDPEFDSEFDVEFVHSHANKELVFHHKPSRTLIEADLLFNLPAIEQYSKSKENPRQGFFSRLFNALNNTAGGVVWQRRFIWHLASSGDRPSFNKSVCKIDKWDFDRIIPCHGDVIETGGKGIFRRVMQWHLRAAQNA